MRYAGRYSGLIHESAIVQKSELYEPHKIQLCYDRNSNRINYATVALKHKTTHKLHFNIYHNYGFSPADIKWLEEVRLYILHFLCSNRAKHYNISMYNTGSHDYLEISRKCTISAAIKRVQQLGEADEDA